MPFATLIDYLDKHQGAATAVLTAALVAITTFYAWQNRKMVAEMKASRDAAIRPKLALDFHALGPNFVDLSIKNVGSGPALDIDVQAEWIPLSDDGPLAQVRWRRNVLVAGEHVELFPPGETSGNLDTLPKLYREIRLSGGMSDAAGNRHEIQEKFADLPEWLNVVVEADESWKQPEPERFANAMYKKFVGPMNELTKATNGVMREIRELKKQAIGEDDN